tara:strand:+ start:561 stop:887 length:327 start_codon:yes stop_codon:yes gene_type:complete
MKNLFYLLTIGGLLWLFFNPNGILTYNSKSNDVRRLDKKEKKHKIERDEHKIKYRWLEELKNSIENKDVEKQKQILEKHGPEIGFQLILRNIFKEDYEALNIKKKKGP